MSRFAKNYDDIYKKPNYDFWCEALFFVNSTKYVLAIMW